MLDDLPPLQAVFVALALSVPMVMVMFFCCGGLGSSSSSSSSGPSFGEEYRLRKTLAAGRTEADWDRISQLRAAKDEDGLMLLHRQGRGMLISAGTKVKVIDAGFLTSEIRILSGPYKGQSVWTVSDFK